MKRFATISAAVACGLMLAVALPLSTPTSRAAGGSRAVLAKKAAVAARPVYNQTLNSYKVGRTPLDAVYRWSLRWLGVTKPSAGATSASAKHLLRMQALYQLVSSKVKAGTATAADQAAARFYLAEAKLWAG